MNLTPQTHIRTTQNDRVCFRIPEEQLLAKYPSLYKRKKYIQRYNDYKDQLRDEAAEKLFKIPNYGAAVTFFLPVFKSWSDKKKKAMHFKLHYSKPDIDNFLKAFQDALKGSDCTIAHYTSLAKRWVNFDTGYIEIVITPGPEPEHNGLLPRRKKNRLS